MAAGRARIFTDRLTAAASEYLKVEAGIEIRNSPAGFHDIDDMCLKEITALIQVTSDFELQVAFSFDRRLLSEIAARFLGVTDGKVDNGDVIDMAGEMINIILGQTIPALVAKGSGQAVNITPPMIIEDATTIVRHKHNRYFSVSLRSFEGDLDILCFGSRQS